MNPMGDINMELCLLSQGEWITWPLRDKLVLAARQKAGDWRNCSQWTLLLRLLISCASHVTRHRREKHTTALKRNNNNQIPTTTVKMGHKLQTWFHRHISDVYSVLNLAFYFKFPFQFFPCKAYQLITISLCSNRVVSALGDGCGCLL